MTTNKPEIIAYRHPSGYLADITTHPEEYEPLIRLSDYEALQADHERLQAELELWKAKVDAMAEHEVAAYQLIGIPASVGISEPVEGFARRPQDIMPAVRDMALRIELLESQLAESEALLAESRANDRQAMAYLAAVREVVGGDDFPEMAERVEALQAECEKLRKDAERYRLLRRGEIDDIAVVRGLGAMDYGMSAVIGTYSEEIDGDVLDAAIDAAMEKENKE